MLVRIANRVDVTFAVFCQGCVFRTSDACVFCAIDELFCSLTQLKIVLCVIWCKQITGLTLIFAACGSNFPKINWCFLMEFPMQWNKFFDWCLGYLARIEQVSFISRFRLVRFLYHQTNFIWCNKKKPSHALEINKWNTSLQNVCLFILCQQRWWTAGINLVHGQF